MKGMESASSGRIRRSVRFARLDAQAGPAGRETARRERMTVGPRLEMPSFQNTQDWTGGMGVSPSGRFRVAEEPGRRRKMFSRDGIRRDLARILLWILLVVLSVTLVVQFASIGAGSLRIRKLESKMAAARSRSEELERELAEKGGDIRVVTRAVEMNLISSGGAPTIRLEAPSGATLTLVETPAQATAEPELRASAMNGE